MSVAENNTIQTDFEVESKLLPSLTMFVKNTQLVSFLSAQNSINFLQVEGATLGRMTASAIFFFYLQLSNAVIKS